MTSYKIKELLKKSEQYDADERYMATEDLRKELNSIKGPLESSIQVPVRQAMLRLIMDKGKDVGTIAIKCLAACVSKLEFSQVRMIAKTLADLTIDQNNDEEKEALRDSFASGLRTIILAVEESHAKELMTEIVPILLRGVQGSNVNARLITMDVLQVLLRRFGRLADDHHDAVLNTLSALLENDNTSVRKSASLTLGPLVSVVGDKLFSTLAEKVISGLSGANPGCYIQTIGIISKAAGVRVGQHLERIIPLLQNFCTDFEGATAEDDRVELWHDCLRAFESLIQQCPTKVTPYIPDNNNRRGLVTLATDMLKWDPNDAGECGAAAMEDEDDGEEDWGDDGDDGEDWGDDGGDAGNGWGDDGGGAPVMDNLSDQSWKVRQAAAGVLSSFVRCRGDILKDYYLQLVESFIARFRERDAVVQEEILLATAYLLRQSVVEETSDNKNENADSEELPDAPMLVRARSQFGALGDKTSDIVDKCCTLYPTADTASQAAVFVVLTELINARQGNVQEFMSKLAPLVVAGISATGSAKRDLVVSALKCATHLLQNHNHASLGPFFESILEATMTALARPADQVKRQALGVLAGIASAGGRGGEFPLAPTLFKCVFAQLKIKDNASSLKVAAIRAMSMLVAHCGNSLSEEIPQVLPVLKERLGNSVSAMATLRAITTIANAECKVDLHYIAITCVNELCSFMRQASSALRHLTVKCLEALVRTQGMKLESMGQIIKELSPHLNDEDLYLTHLTLALLSSCLEANASIAKEYPGSVLPSTLKLAQSPLLQGDCLKSLIQFYQASVTHGKNVSAMSYEKLMKSLLDSVNPNLPSQAYNTIAKCLAGMALTMAKTDGKAQTTKTVAQFTKDITNKKTSDSSKTVALLTIGEIGRNLDLSTDHPKLNDVAFSVFSSQDTTLRTAAAFALGSICVGNMDKFLSKLLNLINTQKEEQYGLLMALRETISASSQSFPQSSTVASLLYERAESPDEGVRVMVAECLGRLAVKDQDILVKLESLCECKSERSREVMVTALRTSFTPEANWDAIESALPKFFKLLDDESLTVRQQAILTLNSLVRSRVDIIHSQLLNELVLPALYKGIEPIKELIETVNYGNFTEVVDGGLSLRRCVFQALGSLVECDPGRLDLQKYITSIQKGMIDNSIQIQMMTMSIFEKLGTNYPSHMLEILDGLPSKIMPCVKGNIKASKIEKTGAEAKDALRSLVKLMLIFNAIVGVEACSNYNYFFKQVMRTPILAAMVEEIQGKK